MILEQVYAKIMRRLYGIRGFGYLPIAENARRKYVKKYAALPAQERYVTINDFVGNLKFRIDRATYMGSVIYWKGQHQKADIAFFKSVLKEDMVFVDMGANQGEFTIAMAAALPKGHVIAFEPIDSLRNDLEQNIALNGFKNVLVYSCGVSDSEDELPIYTSVDTERQQSFNEGLGSLYQTDYLSTQVGIVKLRRFDDIFAETGLKRLDAFKIDIEGAELFALKGAENTIRRFKPRYILIELNPITLNAAGYEAADILHFLSNMGYQWHQLTKHGRLLPPSSLEDIALAASHGGGIDAVAILPN